MMPPSARDGVPARHGTAWSAGEDNRLRALFLAGEPISELAKAHQRKRGAISSRLVKLGLLAEDTFGHDIEIRCGLTLGVILAGGPRTCRGTEIRNPVTTGSDVGLTLQHLPRQ